MEYLADSIKNGEHQIFPQSLILKTIF